MGRYRATFHQGRPLEMAKTVQRPWRCTTHWIRSLCTSTAKVPSRQSMGQSTKPWAQGVPEHMSGAGFWFPTTRSGRSRTRVMRQSATWRRGELPTCAKGETTLQKKGADTHKLAFRVAKTGVACASLAKQAARWAAVLRFRGWDDTRAAAPRSHVFRKTIISTHARSEGTACSWDEFSTREAERWTMPSSSPSMWGGLLGAGGRVMPLLQRNPSGQNITAVQTEVWTVSKQTLPWLDS